MHEEDSGKLINIYFHLLLFSWGRLFIRFVMSRVLRETPKPCVPGQTGRVKNTCQRPNSK